MKNVRLVADRYAQALSRVIRDDAEFCRIGDDLATLARLADESADLRRALANPLIPLQSKRRFLEALARRMDLRRGAVELLNTLAAREHLFLLRLVSRAISRAADKRTGVSEAEIRSAAPLAEETRQRLSAALARFTGGTVRTREVTDPGLLGGLVVRLDGKVLDGSLKQKLETLNARLAGQIT